MGWTWTYRPRGMTDAKFFADQFGENFAKKIKATASKNGMFYAVYETDAAEAPALVPDANGKVRLAIVVFTRRAPKDEYNFGYKEMDEFSGPYDGDNVPEKILKMLSPFRLEAAFAAAKYSRSLRNASRWRQEAWAQVAKRKAKLKLKTGMAVKLPYVLTFQNGAEIDRFVAVKRGNRFVFQNGYTNYRLTRKQQLDLREAA